MRIVILLALVVFGIPGIWRAQGTHTTTASVRVTAVTAFGMELENLHVDAFVDQAGRNRVALFRGGSTASSVPFGMYRVTVHASDYRKSTFVQDVDAPEVLITAGLEWPGLENDRITGAPRGQLAGFPTFTYWWCKASGLYSKLGYESEATPADLRFNFGEVPPGIYVLACVADQKFVVLRIVTISADAMPFTIQFMPDSDGSASQPDDGR